MVKHLSILQNHTHEHSKNNFINIIQAKCLVFRILTGDILTEYKKKGNR